MCKYDVWFSLLIWSDVHSVREFFKCQTCGSAGFCTTDTSGIIQLFHIVSIKYNN